MTSDQRAATAPGRAGRLLPAAVVTAATLVFGSVSLIYPYGRDHGIYAWLAWAVRSGRVMYRDLFMGMAPLTVLVHALAQFFGRSMVVLRVVDLAWTLVTALLFFALVRRVSGRAWPSAAAGALYAFCYYQFGFWDTAQVDGFLNLPVVAALLVALPAFDSAARRRWFAAGCLLGVAFLFKYPAGVFLPGLAAFAFYRWSKARGVFGPGWLVAGFFLPVAVFLLVLTASGALGAYFEPVFRRALSYPALAHLGEGPFGRFLRMFAEYLRRPASAVPLVLGGTGLAAGLVRFARRKAGKVGRGSSSFSRLLVLSSAWLFLALVQVYAQGRFFPYHFLTLLPPLAVAAVAGLAPPQGPGCRTAVRAVSYLLLAVLAVGVVSVTPYRRSFADLARVAAGPATLADYWHLPRQGTQDFRLSEQLQVADYLRARTTPEARVLVWGADPLINYLARRRGVTRFGYHHPLVSAWGWNELRREFIAALAADPPAVIVVAGHDATPLVTGHELDSREALVAFTPLRALVVRDYELEARIARFAVLRRADSDRTPPALPPDRLETNLAEARAAIGGMNPASDRAVLWPGSWPG
ncbi:MAG TPA: hypothetical protein ENN51_01725, partial [candidate division WOR-3 bacterium]|nr:hypothetical protein [candidate division WOR-3 bacterium]